ncbi:hypothetical protein [Rhizobium sp. PAMB 3182]
MEESLEPPSEYKLRDPVNITISMTAIGKHLSRCETIEHEGCYWLVPQWIENKEQGWMRPVRIISLRDIPHEVKENRDPPILVTEGLPEDAEPPNDPIQTAERTLVVDLPKIWFSIPVAN